MRGEGSEELGGRYYAMNIFFPTSFFIHLAVVLFNKDGEGFLGGASDDLSNSCFLFANLHMKTVTGHVTVLDVHTPEYSVDMKSRHYTVSFQIGRTRCCWFLLNRAVLDGCHSRYFTSCVL